VSIKYMPAVIWMRGRSSCGAFCAQLNVLQQHATKQKKAFFMGFITPFS